MFKENQSYKDPPLSSIEEEEEGKGGGGEEKKEEDIKNGNVKIIILVFI